MQRTLRRLMSGVFGGLALSALAASPAIATTTTTKPASNTTTTTVLLNGVIDTGGVGTAWQFQWGKTRRYGKASPLQQIQAGGGSFLVSSTLEDLSPNTTYHFRLVATTGGGGGYYPLNIANGQDLTFTTKATGRLLLVQAPLTVTNGNVAVPLRCDSGLSCVGRFTIDTRAKLQNVKKLATVLCATRSFDIRRHKTATLTARVRAACLSLLAAASHHRITGLLTSNPRTGQHAVIRTVGLVLR